MKNLINNPVINSAISEAEIIESTVIKGIELYASRLLKTSKGAKSTFQVSPELDSRLNALQEFLGLTRQEILEEATYTYWKWALYARHINGKTINM